MFLFGAKSKEAETVEFDFSDVYGIIKRTIKKDEDILCGTVNWMFFA